MHGGCVAFFIDRNLVLIAKTLVHGFSISMFILCQLLVEKVLYSQ